MPSVVPFHAIEGFGDLLSQRAQLLKLVEYRVRWLNIVSFALLGEESDSSKVLVERLPCFGVFLLHRDVLFHPLLVLLL